MYNAAHEAPRDRAPVWPLLLLGLLAGVALLWPPLALPAGFACFIAVIKAWSAPSPRSRRAWLAVAMASLLATIAVVRFVMLEAMPGIVGGGRQAVEQRAVSRLREVLFAQDAMRRAAWIDPDRDGVGSAAFLGELCGEGAVRGQPQRDTPVLHCSELVRTPLGPAATAAGYLYTVCLPLAAGGWSAVPGSSLDEERAERSFVAYAWPAPGAPFNLAFFIDEHENILSLDLSEQFGKGDRAAVPEAFGLTCESALGAGRQRFRPWRGKRPRENLPGEGNARR
jgi:hypothetical protein